MKKGLLIYTLILTLVLGMTGCSSKGDMALTGNSQSKESDVSYEYSLAATETAEETTQAEYEMKEDSNSGQAQLIMEEEVMDMDSAEQMRDGLSGETYAEIRENQFILASQENTSTFSIDVDTASYTNIRRMIMDGGVPDPNAVRIEEMINYFDYDYPQPTDGSPFSISTATALCPWNPDNLVTMIGLKGYELDPQDVPPSNVVLLIDVSGSMNSPDKLPLLKEGFKTLARQFTQEDKVSIVVYAGAAGVVLDGANGAQFSKIEDALDSLQAGGSTAGGAGIELAYSLASQYFIEDGNNRVILATDGDFNVGISSTSQLETFIEEKRETGIFLSVIGFGTGNIRDDVMETLADKGNGNYAYIDSSDEAIKVFSKEFSGTMFTIAKDVKIQMAFNENLVKSYRLIGYENRVMDNQDFEDDTKDAGELGAGHEVTAIYELVMTNGTPNEADSLYDVKLRYKEPDEDQSNEIIVSEKNSAILSSADQDRNLLWALTVAEFGMVLRDSQYAGEDSLQRVYNQARLCTEQQDDPLKLEFLDLVTRIR